MEQKTNQKKLPSHGSLPLKVWYGVFAETHFWLPCFCSVVVKSSIEHRFPQAEGQTCRHPRPWMASFIGQRNWPGKLALLTFTHPDFFPNILQHNSMNYCVWKSPHSSSLLHPRYLVRTNDDKRSVTHKSHIYPPQDDPKSPGSVHSGSGATFMVPDLQPGSKRA